jgi:hypothetical protein
MIKFVSVDHANKKSCINISKSALVIIPTRRTSTIPNESAALLGKSPLRSMSIYSRKS